MARGRTRNTLLCWEADETDSWNPVLARELRRRGHGVTEVHGLDDLRTVDPSDYDLTLPRFRIRAAHMASVDDELVHWKVPMLNSRATRRTCEHKGLAHQAFARVGIDQPPWLVLGAEGVADRAETWEGESIIKPLCGSRGAGIEILPTLEAAMTRGLQRGEDLLVQRMIWPARSWRVIVGRASGIVDPYWRRPPTKRDRVLSISTGSRIAREPLPAAGCAVAEAMLAAVEGDLLAVDLLETAGRFYALEINHNFDAHGATVPAVDAFECEITRLSSVWEKRQASALRSGARRAASQATSGA